MIRGKLYLRLSLFFLIVMFSTSSFSNQGTATIDPTADLSSIKSIHVSKLGADGRGINLLIANKFRTMGYIVSTGADIPNNTDVIVTYKDRWAYS